MTGPPGADTNSPGGTHELPSQSAHECHLTGPLLRIANRRPKQRRNLLRRFLVQPSDDVAVGVEGDILAEAAGIQAGSWYASPATRAGYELVAAGMLIMAAGHDGKPLDYKAFERWTRVGYERGMKCARVSGEAICVHAGRNAED